MRLSSSYDPVDGNHDEVGDDDDYDVNDHDEDHVMVLMRMTSRVQPIIKEGDYACHSVNVDDDHGDCHHDSDEDVDDLDDVNDESDIHLS